MRRKYTISFRKNRRFFFAGSWIGMYISMLSMTAGGAAAIEISRMWTRSYLLEIEGDTVVFHEEPCEEKTLGQISDLIKNMSYRIEQGKKAASGKDEGLSSCDAIIDESRTAEFVPITQRKIDRTSPERLNYAFLFDEEALKENPMDSYAGRTYQQLSERDGLWIRELYELGQIPPEQMAAHLGIDVSGVSSWNRVKVAFRNGDDVPVSGSSNAKEIVSMASVYAYFQQWDDYDSFFRYADALWKKSHSYRIAVSDMYYCEGDCQYIKKSDSGTDTDGESERSIGDEDAAKVSEGGMAGEENIASGVTEEGGVAEAARGDDTAGADGESSIADAAEENGAAGAAEESNAAAEAETNTETMSVTSETGGGIVRIESGQDAGGESIAMLVDSEERLLSEKDTPAGRGELSATQAPADGEGIDSGKACAGHMDLDISVRITGLKETRSLYETDSVGNMEENFKDQWSGWDTDMRSYADNLAGQDWYALYGLFSPNCVYLRNSLSQSETAFYMNKLSDTTSSSRREIVRVALESVGCIPYYWGGKPWSGGFEGNHFGTVVEADEEGRSLRGLDCSGWISWVYWTVFGNPLPAQSTSGLVSCGRGISKEELQAGDILIRTGEQPHVYLFLAWAEDGTMYLIHETTGNVNNVTINTYDVEVTHYRNLIGEE